MRHWLKSNSILVAVDAPNQNAENRRGLFFIGLQDAFGFSVNIPRAAQKQMGSQVFAINSVTLAPDIEFDLSFVPTRKFEVEQALGLNFGFNPTFESVLLGKSETSFNVYLFISDKQSHDFIKQLRDSQSLNGVECIAIGNSYLTQYGFSMNVGDLARASASLVGSNMEASVVENNRVRLPQINFQTGEKFGDYYHNLDWPQLEKALDEIELQNQPILPTTQVKFGLTNNNLDVPSSVISPLLDAKIQSLELGVSISREASYGFASNFPYARKINYPVEGSFNMSTVFANTNSGSFTGLMGRENLYSFQFDFLDPQEIFLSGKTTGELATFLQTGVSGASGFFTDSRSLLISGAKLNNWRQDFPINNLTTFEAGLTFQCSEAGGLMSRYGTNGGSQPYHFYTPESRKLFDTSGNLLTHESFLYMYTTGCERSYVMDVNGHLILAENWSSEDNACPYTPIPDAPSPPPNITSLVDVNPQITVSWNSSSNTTGYVVQISEDSLTYEDSVEGMVLGSPLDIESSSDFVRGNESFYFFRVVAYGAGGQTTGNVQSIYIP